MKKYIAIIITACLIFCLASCQKANNKDETTAVATQPTTLPPEYSQVGGATAEEILVVSFSHNDNVMNAASYIADETGGVLFSIKTVATYPEGESELESLAESEFTNNVRPALETKVEDFHSAGVVFVCYPVWAKNMPMALYTFLEDYDMRDKFIIPVCISKNGEWENSLDSMRALLSSSMFVEGTVIKDSDVTKKESEIRAFAKNALK